MSASSNIRAAVSNGTMTPEHAGDLLGYLMCPSDAEDGKHWACPECGAVYLRTPFLPDGRMGSVNTCSYECQVAINTASFDIDAMCESPRIHKVSEFTAERLDEDLRTIGLTISAGPLEPS